MRFLLLVILLGFGFSVSAQEALDYQKPPQEILELVDIKRAPSVRIDSDATTLLLLYRDAYQSIEDLSAAELRLAGLRINPDTHISSRIRYYNNLKIQDIQSGKIRSLTGLPANPKLAYVSWSPDERKVAFTHTDDAGVSLWVADLERLTAIALTQPNLNANLDRPYSWLKDSETLLIKTIPENRQPLIDTDTEVPTGPTVSTSDGAKAQNRTYQDLLSNPQDEFNFEQLARADIKQVNLKGQQKHWADTAMYRGLDVSPDGDYVMVSQVQRPFSYLVPYYRFPSQTDILKKSGKLVKTVNQVPLIEDLPKGFMAVRTGKRNLQWRSDQPATLIWVEALDDGDPENEVDYRDEVFQQAAPFKKPAESLFKTQLRFYQLTWGDDSRALFFDYWWNSRQINTSLFNPSDLSQAPKLINSRSYQDVYADPGRFMLVKNKYGEDVLRIHDNKAFLLGDGFSEAGQFPFYDELDLSSFDTKRIYQSAYTDKLETLVDIISDDGEKLLVRIEAPNEFPNYYIRDIEQDKLTEITDFENPFKSLSHIHKEVIQYKREDGVDLSATLYLPADYDFDKKPKLPMILWAYPTEFKDQANASQNRQNPNEFTYASYGSMIYWVTRGYAVLDDAAFPIVGEGDEEPNDTFIQQLVANGDAAVKAVADMGYIDPERVAVAGHSYGAFMTANLLSHSDTFAAGIARSGAYNRTLTPFGFQAEERNYWEAPEIYYNMSPFMHADKMNEPLLLIHGAADNNSGTYPMQSERYFNALKGLGATARLVMLPKESHGYRAKESILHVLWEQDQWLEKYVKHKGSE
ncbi:MAG: prolyl oligopeptidase family serine peptidase [Marinicella pacifica]